MTGDGAVVDTPAWFCNHWRATHGSFCHCGMCVVARAYLAQAAEIERLTRERDEYKAALRDAHEAGHKTHQLWSASEARAAGLLKALERYGEHIVGECAKWHWLGDHSAWMQTDADCTCGFSAAKEKTT